MEKRAKVAADWNGEQRTRERPSALDVETVGAVLLFLYPWQSGPTNAKDAARFAAEYARLTGSDGGEGTDPMLGTPADGRHPDHGPCGQTPCPHIPTPDTTEATLRAEPADHGHRRCDIPACNCGRCHVCGAAIQSEGGPE